MKDLFTTRARNSKEPNGDFRPPLPFAMGFAGRLRSTFSPASLFLTADNGYIFDPSVFSSMFQDSAGTIPVTAIGQSVGRMLDLSGKGNHRIQATDAARPVLGQETNGAYYLSYPGANGMYTAAAVNLSGSDKVTVCAGLKKLSDAASSIYLEHSANLGANNGAFLVAAPTNAAEANWNFIAKGTASAGAPATGAAYAAPQSRVVMGQADIANDQTILDLDGAQAAIAVTDLGSGNFGNYVSYFGRRNNASNAFNGLEYAVTCINRLLTPDQRADLKRWTNQKSGLIY